MKFKHRPNIEQKEQNPVNWTELNWEDINKLEVFINTVHNEYPNGIGQKSFGEEVLERFREYKGDEDLDEKEQKPAEWSEEDENTRCDIIARLESLSRYETQYIAKACLQKEISWLKSLRPQPQRKDTYYDIIHNILASLKDVDFMQITPEHRVSLLNDIRVKCKNADECAVILDEPHWKPSKEQLNALHLLNYHARFTYIGQQKDLISLYDDLKKL